MANKIDISSFQIAASKMRADGNAYFKLFEKHVPRNLDMNNVVLLYKLDNLSCICNIINMNIKVHYVVVSNDAVNTALQVVVDKSIDVEYIEEFDFKETDMKFDCIIMNPPYGKNTNYLYAKIFNQAVKHSSHVVSLNPAIAIIRGDECAKWKDLADFFKNVTNADIINPKHVSKLFDAAFSYELGIVEHIDGQPSIDLSRYKKTDAMYEKIYSKVQCYCGKIIPYLSKNCVEGKTMKCSTFHGHPGCLDRLEYFSRKFETLITPFMPSKDGKIRFNGKNKMYLNLDNMTQLKNFYNSVLNNVYAYLKINNANFCFWDYCKFPFLGNVENPRTHKIGYDSDWTKEDLVNVFNLTDDEVAHIDKSIEDFKEMCK